MNIFATMGESNKRYASRQEHSFVWSWEDVDDEGL